MQEDNSFSILPNDAIYNIIKFTRYADIANLLIADRRLYSLVIKLIGYYTIPELPSDIYQGIITILKRYSPDRRLDNDFRQGRLSVPKIDSDLYSEIIRALGWRKFSSTLKIDKERNKNNISLASLTQEIITHAALTYKLRQLPNKIRYPSRPYIQKDDSRSYINTEDVQQLTTHWKDIYQMIGYERDYHAHDVLALSIAKKESLISGGQNVSVASQGTSTFLYTNNPLNRLQVDHIQNNYPVNVAPHSQEGGQSFFTCEHGINRKSNGFLPHLPFHSEMLRTLDQEPWELEYAGNSYLACMQCLVSYFAIGVTLFRGSHMQKVPSIIPPKIRNNTVYLQYYIGEDLWQKLITEFEDLSELVSFLDYIERYDSNFFTAYNQMVPKIGLMGSKPEPNLISPATAGAISNPGGTKRLYSAAATPGNAKSGESPGKSTAIICPRCNSSMRLKDGKFGPFYGCSNWPNCKYTKNK